jgi:hypothetical protein
MGYKDYSVKLKNKVDESIERLCDTNIYNIGGGIYNPLTKEYITDSKYQIGILSDYKTYNYITMEDENGNEVKKINKKSLKDKVSVKVDLFFLKNLLSGKGKISDRNLRLSLKLDISRRMYLILNKWRIGRSKFFLKFETLYARVPLTNDKSNYYRKRRLKDACEELKIKGYIYDYIVTKEGIEFIFKEQIEQEQEILLKCDKLLEKYNEYDEIISGLKNYGLTEEVIKKHFKLHQIPYIQALLRFMDDRIDTIDNPLNYIFKGLIEPYKNIDEKYYNK